MTTLEQLKKAMAQVNTSEPEFKTYKLMYYFGVWHTKEVFAAENDAEAIADADSAQKYPLLNYALWCGNRKVKEYNNK